MKVSCPNCSTAYEIPPPVKPRRLRCARCETEWRELPPEPELEPEPAEEPVQIAPEPADEPLPDFEDAPPEQHSPPITLASPLPLDAIMPPPAVKSRHTGTVWAVLWVLSLVLVAAALFAAWHFRVAIEHLRPETLRLFRLIPGGVPPAR